MTVLTVEYVVNSEELIGTTG